MSDLKCFDPESPLLLQETQMQFGCSRKEFQKITWPPLLERTSLCGCHGEGFSIEKKNTQAQPATIEDMLSTHAKR